MSPFSSNLKVTATEEKPRDASAFRGKKKARRMSTSAICVVEVMFGPANIRKMRFGAKGRIGGVDGRRDEQLADKLRAQNETA